MQISDQRSISSISTHESVQHVSSTSSICDNVTKPKQPAFCPWKPVTLQAPLLLSISAFTLSMIILLEYLARLSQRNGGIAFADGDFSSLVTFTYLYLPVMISVFYSMLWAWIDLDAKRLEPYFQMSKHGGAREEDSLSLHYPFDFVAFAPIRALRRRHWSVAVAGWAMVLIFWIVTPVVGSVFATSNVRRVKLPTNCSMSAIVPMEQQTRDLDVGFLSIAYGVLWLGQSLPNYTTTASAFRPFVLGSGGLPVGSNETWTTTTSEYSTSLDCRPAIIKESGSSGSPSPGFIFDDGKGCRTTAMDLQSLQDRPDRYLALYIGYNLDTMTDWSLPVLGCPDAKHTFLAIWAGANMSPTRNLSAIFCQASYLVRDVNATVTAPNMTVAEVSSVQERSALSERDFNASNFEYVVGVGIGANPPRADIPQRDTIDQSPRLHNMSLISPTTNMVGFAIGASHLQPAEYLDPKILASSFEKAHQLLFALAMRQLMSSAMHGVEPKNGVIHDDTRAVTVVRSLAIIIESALAIAIILALTLLCKSHLRRSQIREDPSSLGRILSLIPKKPETEALNIASVPPLADKTSYALYQGELEDLQGPGERAVTETGAPIRPFEMTTKIAVAFITILCSSIVAIGILKHIIEEQVGLPLPSAKNAVNQIVLNYVPIIFATLLEPFWVLLNRNLCVLRPFEALRKSDAAASQSLDVKYTSLPPQLIFWWAMRAKHFLLVAVCGISLSANILAVSLSALFETKSILMKHKTGFPIQRTPEFVSISPKSTLSDTSRYEDHFHVANTNITNGTPLPSWVTSEAYHLPFDLNSVNTIGNTNSFTAVTPAIGAAMSCTQVNGSDGRMRAHLNFANATGAINLAQKDAINLTVTDTGNHQFNCSSPSVGLLTIAGSSGSRFAGEVVTNMEATSSDPSHDEVAFCSSTLLIAFLRAHIVVNSPVVSAFKGSLTITSFESLYLTCQPKLLIAPSEVTVDPNGRVISSVLQGAYATNLDSLFDSHHNAIALYAEANRLISSGKELATGVQTLWHIDAFADDWFTYLIKISLNSSDFLNASLPVPSAETIIPTVQDLYTRLFAILLGTNQDMLAPAIPGATTNGTVNAFQERVFMTQSMFIITVTLLSLNIVVAIAYYVKRPKRMLLEMPTTLASVLRLFEGSGLVRESTCMQSQRDEWKLGYGRFVGTDGKPHLGIERRPFVIPLND